MYTVLIDPCFAWISVTTMHKRVVFRLKSAVNYGKGKQQAGAEVLTVWEKG